MPLKIVRNDITLMDVDCIVNSANQLVKIGHGVDSSIHKKAGKELIEARKLIGNINIGEAYLTKGYNLKARHVIHTVGPLWINGFNNEHIDLKKCYLSALRLAKENNFTSIAFPLISTGTYGYPKDEALKIAIETIKAFLDDYEMLIYLVVYDEESFLISKKLEDDVFEYIKNNYIKEKLDLKRSHNLLSEKVSYSRFESKQSKRSISDVIDEIEETFVETLFRHTDEKAMSDVELYKKANIDRKLFSKIKSNFNYQPSKETAIALALSLELNIDETKDLLKKAGYALSPSKKFDLIIQYFIETNNYDLYELNLVLFKFKQKTL